MDSHINFKLGGRCHDGSETGFARVMPEPASFTFTFSGVAYGNDRYLLAQSTKFGTHIL